MGIKVDSVQSDMRVKLPWLVVTDLKLTISKKKGEEKIRVEFNLLANRVRATKVQMSIVNKPNDHGLHIPATKITGKKVIVEWTGINAINGLLRLKQPGSRIVLYFKNDNNSTVAKVNVPKPTNPSAVILECISVAKTNVPKPKK